MSYAVAATEGCTVWCSSALACRQMTGSCSPGWPHATILRLSHTCVIPSLPHPNPTHMALGPHATQGGDADDVLLGSDRVPCCVECARKMRYVGELSCGAFAEDLFDIPISLFYCHDCGVQVGGWVRGVGRAGRRAGGHAGGQMVVCMARR